MFGGNKKERDLEYEKNLKQYKLLEKTCSSANKAVVRFLDSCKQVPLLGLCSSVVSWSRICLVSSFITRLFVSPPLCVPGCVCSYWQRVAN